MKRTVFLVIIDRFKTVSNSFGKGIEELETSSHLEEYINIIYKRIRFLSYDQETSKRLLMKRRDIVVLTFSQIGLIK